MTIEAQLERIATALEVIAGRSTLAVAAAQVKDVLDLTPIPNSPMEGNPVLYPATAKRKRRTKAEMEAARATPQETTPASAPSGVEKDAEFDFLGAPPVPVSDTTVIYTKDNVRTALIAYQEAHGKDTTFDFIKRFGGTNLNDLPEANYAALIAAAK